MCDVGPSWCRKDASTAVSRSKCCCDIGEPSGELRCRGYSRPCPRSPLLHVCWIDKTGAPIHPCAKAGKALTDAGIAHDRKVFGRGHPFGLLTTGRRPDLKALSGQEKLPVLELPDGSTVNGSNAIVEWAKAHAGA